MISKTEKKRLKKILGSHYTTLVQEELQNKGVVNQNNNPHSANQIIGVFNGIREHEQIEEAIYAAAETAIAKNLLIKSKREKILKSA